MSMPPIRNPQPATFASSLRKRLERLARPRHPEPLPVTFDRRRVYILPSRFGWFFLLLLFAMGIGALNYNNNPALLLALLLAGAANTSLYAAHLQLSGLRIIAIDAEPVAAGKPLPLRVDVAVKLGDDVKLSGLGLDGRVSGQLSISQHGARAAVGTGTLNAQGTYRAYGQNLQIESGRVLFAGTALDNPGLDIRAVRTIPTTARSALDGGITAGLQVRGTARAPVLTVFSRPAMEQSEALSYLLTGKPLSGLKSGEGDMLGAAARALGSATGDLLAKGIGARLGVDAGVTDDAALGGAAFTVGRYLSPKLYLSYGVGLFTPGEVVSLKYFLGRRWTIEAQNATTGSRAGINYRHER